MDRIVNLSRQPGPCGGQPSIELNRGVALPGKLTKLSIHPTPERVKLLFSAELGLSSVHLAWQR